MAWISERISALLTENEIRFSNVSWPEVREDAVHKVHTLSFHVEENEYNEKFTEENISALLSDKKIRGRIEERLRTVVEKIVAVAVIDKDIEVEDLSEQEPRLNIQYSITSYGADYPVDGLVRRLQSDSIFIPPFQRKFVWKKAQASRFIESLLLGLPVPGVFLAKEADSQRLLVIDGQQRLRTLQFFYEGVFQKSEFDLVDVDPKFEGLTYRTLLEEDRRRLNDSIVHATVVKQEYPEENDNSIYLVFERLNSGASLLHPQEIRACIFHGEFNKLLGSLNQYPSWRAVYGPENSRMKDQELILRFFALYFDAEKYTQPMEGALNRYMKSNRNLQRQDTTTLERTFYPTIDLISESLGVDAFRPVRALNAAVFDAVMVGLARRLGKQPQASPARLREAYEALLVDPEFQAAYERSTSGEEQVRKRLTIATTQFASV
jgi:hypothetical protein